MKRLPPPDPATAPSLSPAWQRETSTLNDFGLDDACNGYGAFDNVFNRLGGDVQEDVQVTVSRHVLSVGGGNEVPLLEVTLLAGTAVAGPHAQGDSVCEVRPRTGELRFIRGEVLPQPVASAPRLPRLNGKQQKSVIGHTIALLVDTKPSWAVVTGFVRDDKRRIVTLDATQPGGAKLSVDVDGEWRWPAEKLELLEDAEAWPEQPTTIDAELSAMPVMPAAPPALPRVFGISAQDAEVLRDGSKAIRLLVYSGGAPVHGTTVPASEFDALSVQSVKLDDGRNCVGLAARQKLSGCVNPSSADGGYDGVLDSRVGHTSRFMFKPTPIPDVAAVRQLVCASHLLLCLHSQLKMRPSAR